MHRNPFQHTRKRRAAPSFLVPLGGRAGRSPGLGAPRRLQAGLTLLEIVFAMGILASALAGLFQLVEWQERRSQAAIFGQQAAAIGQAMQSYVTDHWAPLMDSATPGTPIVLGIEDLVPKYLPANTTATNTYGQAICGLVLLNSAGNSLNVLLVSEGGTPIEDMDLAKVASELGAAGGAYYADNTRTQVTGLTGTQKGWAIPAASPEFAAYSSPNIPSPVPRDASQPPAPSSSRRCSGSAGTVLLKSGHYAMALWYGRTFDNEDVLYRKKVGSNPSLNTMATPLGLYKEDASVADRPKFGGSCERPGQLAAGSEGVMLNCREDDGGVPRWANFYVEGKDAGVAFGKACTANGAYATDASGTPLVCRKGLWTTGLPRDATVVPDGPCTVEGATVTDADGRPFFCQRGQWVAFNRTSESSVKVFSTPGTYSWTVPDGVNEVLVSMAGGGQSGGPESPKPSNYKDVGGPDLPYLVNLTPGGSGGFMIDHPVKVKPGDTLSIQVGHGAPENNDYVNYELRGFPGGPSSVSGSGVDLYCTGGGDGAITPPGGVSGSPGHCNVAPSGGTYGVWVMRQGSGTAVGGQTPLGYGAGGQSGRCWGSCGINAVVGGPGQSGVVMLRWKA